MSNVCGYVNLKKAFDSKHREALWDVPLLRGIVAMTIGLMTGLYSGAESHRKLLFYVADYCAFRDFTCGGLRVGSARCGAGEC